MNDLPLLNTRFPGGCYIGFNALIDRKAMEQLVYVCTEAVRNGFGEMTLCLTSAGGLLEHAYYAVNILDALPCRIITHNLSSIQSASNLLFLCGDERYGSEGATFWFHQTSFEFVPGQRVTEAYATARIKQIEQEDSRSAGFIAAKTGRSVESVRGWQNTELIMDTRAAIEHGIVHAVRPLLIPDNAFFHQVLV